MAGANLGNFDGKLGKGGKIRNPGKNLPGVGAGKVPNPPGLRSYGPAVAGLRNEAGVNVTGPLTFIHAHPEIFGGGTTSNSEGYIYWALLKILGPEGDQWSYQSSVLGGRHSPGGAVVDFVLYLPNAEIGLRIQTYRFHESAPVSKRMYDTEQLVDIFRADFLVIDIYEQDFIFDETGQAAIRLCLEAMGNLQRPDPVSSGLTVGFG